MPATIGQALIVAVVVGALGLGYNYDRLAGGALLAVTRHRPLPVRDHKYLSLDEAADAFAQGDALFVDSRGETRFEAAHIPGAINVPFGRIEEHLDRLAYWIPTDTQVIVYGQAHAFKPMFAVEAALIRAGFDPLLLRANFGIWQDRSLPVVTGTDVVWEAP